ncbi:MAG: hypothetical protein J3K34DRAFT_247226 [Monoraphidium minutum]|nr:MAG: hypothetical protein J3K34DRAFT_247226 [Monoraphidium minutum]
MPLWWVGRHVLLVFMFMPLWWVVGVSLNVKGHCKAKALKRPCPAQAGRAGRAAGWVAGKSRPRRAVGGGRRRSSAGLNINTVCVQRGHLGMERQQPAATGRGRAVGGAVLIRGAARAIGVYVYAVVVGGGRVAECEGTLQSESAQTALSCPSGAGGAGSRLGGRQIKAEAGGRRRAPPV